MPAISKKYPVPKSTEDQIPEFGSDALRSLAENIKSNIKNQGKRAIVKDVAARSKTRAPNAKKKIEGHEAKDPVSTYTVQAASNGTTPRRKQKPIVKASQGKKRLRDGRIKEESHGAKFDNFNSTKLGTRYREIRSDTDINIDDEIRVLGGTKEDVELIANVMSESEIEGEEANPSNNLGNGFEKEILQMVRSIGIDSVAREELMADSESGKGGEGEEQDKDRDPDMAQKVERIGVKSALQDATSVGKGQRSLVSKQ